eukprot:1158908-Pelagomonas_calceolata.AAC.3
MVWQAPPIEPSPACMQTGSAGRQAKREAMQPFRQGGKAGRQGEREEGHGGGGRGKEWKRDEEGRR